MRKLPEKLTTKQRKFIRENDWVTPGSEDFWELWDGEGMEGGGGISSLSRDRQAAIQEAEHVLLHLQNRQLHLEVKCRNCQRIFLTNYQYNKHCSEDCLAETIQKTIGVTWNPSKPLEERWGGAVPAVIRPETIKQLPFLLKEDIPTHDSVSDLHPVNSVNGSSNCNLPIQPKRSDVDLFLAELPEIDLTLH